MAYEVFLDRFACAKRRDTPEWLTPKQWAEHPSPNGAITAQEFFGGDLDGVREALPYLQSLGVNTLYLTPFFPARSTHRYDPTTFTTVDPLLGGTAALKRLTDAAHELNMHVIGDITLNHISEHHDWFRNAKNDSSSPYRDWFFFSNDGTHYECWDNLPHLPKLNWESQTLRDTAIPEIAKWVGKDYGLDGWRIDAANMVGVYREENYSNEILGALSSSMRALNSEAIIIAEHNHDATNLLDNPSIQGIMNYASVARILWDWLGTPTGTPFFGHLIPPTAISATTAMERARVWQTIYGLDFLAHSFSTLSTHDTPRIASLWDSPAYTQIALTYMFMSPGMPLLLYGEELELLGETGESGRLPFQQPPRTTSTPLQKQIVSLASIRKNNREVHSGRLRWIFANQSMMMFCRYISPYRLILVALATQSGSTVIPNPFLGAPKSIKRIFGSLRVENIDTDIQISGPAGASVWLVNVES